ncbi:MAG: hypothetical protein EOO46_11790 [Flavobacterium sp.]|nr:MAG: hypothetical protein EOO46_11790 [Flavobacterium sp.]
MRISFQIIHNYQAETLKVLGQAVHLTMQDDLYIQLDLRTALDFIKINLEKTIVDNEQLCYFEVEIDTATYDLSKYDEFINGFLSRLSSEPGFVRLVKFVDELRNEEYRKYYIEIAEIEMKLREVFSYIFYNRYGHDEVDEMNEYVVRFPAEPPKKNEYIERLENPFYYFTFNGYKDYFQKPREIPNDIKDFKDLISKIRTIGDFEALKEALEVKGLSSLKHIDFILGVKEDLDSIEKLRNCVAHNRTATPKIVGSYIKSKEKLEQQIAEFWNEEKMQTYASREINFAEQFSYERVKDILSVAEWNEYNKEVVLHDFWQTGTPSVTFNNLADLKAHLVEIADNEAAANFPSNEDDREPYERIYNGDILVEKILTEYKRELIVLEWL